MSVKKMKQFEDHIREAFEGHEAPYNPKAWSKLEASLGGKLGGFSSSLKIASVVAVIATSGFGLNYFSDSNSEITNSIEPTQISTSAAQLEVKNADSNEEVPIQLTDESSANEASAVLASTAEVEQSDLKVETAFAASVVAAAPKIKEPKLPKQALEISTSNACLGELIEFRVETDKSVVWEFGDGKVQYGKSVAHRYSSAGVYIAKVSVLDNRDQAMQVLNSSELRINDIPNPDFEFERPCDNAQASIVFDASNPEIQNIWKLGDGSVLEGAHVEHKYEKMGFFKAKHIVENEFGCRDSVTKRVAVCRAYNLLAPKSFNPSLGGWFPIGLKKGDVSFDLKIMDSEAGDLVFQSSNSQDEWDGVVAHSGKKSKSGQSFLWIAVVKDATGKISENGGDIQIVDSE